MDQKQFGYLYWLTSSAYFAARDLQGARSAELEDAEQALMQCTPETAKRDLFYALENAQHNVVRAIRGVNRRSADEITRAISHVADTLTIWDSRDDYWGKIDIVRVADYVNLGYLYWLTSSAYFAARDLQGARSAELEYAKHYLQHCTAGMMKRQLMWSIDDAQHHVFMALIGIFNPSREYVYDLLRIVRTSLMIMDS